MADFTYLVDQVADDKGDGFHSVEFVLRDVKLLPTGILRRNRRNQEEQIFASLEWAVNSKQLKEMDRLNSTQLAEMLAAWQKSGDEPKPAKTD